MGLKAKIEAILFLNSNPLTAPDIAAQAHADLEMVRIALSQLVQDYEEREDCGLMIDTSSGYLLQVREDYENLSQDILEIELEGKQYKQIRYFRKGISKSQYISVDLINKIKTFE